MKKIYVFLIVLFSISSCSLYRSGIRSRCIELNQQTALHNNLKPEVYNRVLSNFINRVSKNTRNFMNGYKRDKNKPAGLCWDLYRAAQHENRTKNDYLISAHDASYINKKHSTLYRNIYEKRQSMKPVESQCMDLNRFIGLHKKDAILGTKGMDIADKKAYSRALEFKYRRNKDICNIGNGNGQNRFNLIYKGVKRTLKIKTVRGCESFAKNVSKSALTSEIKGKYPVNNPIYRAFYSDYQHCLNLKSARN